MEQHAEGLKELHVQAIAGGHPERPSDITETQYLACSTFLAHFAGESRKGKACGSDLQGNIFTLNYDLLLYWTLMHDKIKQVDNSKPFVLKQLSTEYIPHDDGFRSPDDEPEAAYVAWDGEEAYHQNVFYLHGALHLYDYGHELQKKCWERAGNVPLIDQIRGALNEGVFPCLFRKATATENSTAFAIPATCIRVLVSFTAH